MSGRRIERASLCGADGVPSRSWTRRVPPTSQNRRHERPSGSAHAQIRPESQVRSKGITLAGTMLILGLTVLAFAGGRLFGPCRGTDHGSPGRNDGADCASAGGRSGCAGVGTGGRDADRTSSRIRASSHRLSRSGARWRGPRFCAFSRAASRPWKRRCSCSSTHGTSRRAWNNVGMK